MIKRQELEIRREKENFLHEIPLNCWGGLGKGRRGKGRNDTKKSVKNEALWGARGHREEGCGEKKKKKGRFHWEQGFSCRGGQRKVKEGKKKHNALKKIWAAHQN